MFRVFAAITLIVVLNSSQCNCGGPVVVPVTRPVQHGEGPYWDRVNQVLYYVDTFAPTILRWNPIYNKITSQHVDGDSVGLLVPVSYYPNTFLVCHDRKVSLFYWGGQSNNTGIFGKITSVDEDKANNQFNDGKVDAKGRLWAGTLTRNDDLSVTPNGGCLYSMATDNLASPRVQISPVSISNGVAWSKDNTKFFYIDSQTRTVVSYAFNLSTGTIASPLVLFDLEEHPNLQGIPDGMTIDRDDNLWVALYGGKSVIKVNSTSGELLRVLPMPATYVTSATFGGPNYDILFITTSKLKLTSEQQIEEPLAGSVFAAYNLGARGWPANSFRFYWQYCIRPL